MLDIKLIREDPEPFRQALARRGLAERVDELLAADERRRELTQRVEALRAEQNRASKAIGRASGDEKQTLIAEVAKVSAELKELEPEHAEAETALTLLLASTPNLPHPSAPDGFTDEDAVEVRRVGDPPRFDFEPKDHAELGAALGVLDVERGARTSGSRFVYLLGDLVFVQFALMRNAMDVLVEKGFTPSIPPVLVREEAMFASAFLPTDEVNIYRTDTDQLYLIGTSEVSLAALHMEEILEEGSLPLRYAGYSTCFRREAGSYGKDLGGMFRVHQFDKVEMFSFATPESSWDEHEFLVSIEEEIIRPGALPRAHVVLELHRLRCPPVADAGASSGRIGGDAPHAQWNGHGDRPDPDRDLGEQPASGRLRGHPGTSLGAPSRASEGANASRVARYRFNQTAEWVARDPEEMPRGVPYGRG